MAPGGRRHRSIYKCRRRRTRRAGSRSPRCRHKSRWGPSRPRRAHRSRRSRESRRSRSANRSRHQPSSTRLRRRLRNRIRRGLRDHRRRLPRDHPAAAQCSAISGRRALLPRRRAVPWKVPLSDFSPATLTAVVVSATSRWLRRAGTWSARSLFAAMAADVVRPPGCDIPIQISGSADILQRRPRAVANTILPPRSGKRPKKGPQPATRALPPKVRFATDFSLEQRGFEPSVPVRGQHFPRLPPSTSRRVPSRFLQFRRSGAQQAQVNPAGLRGDKPAICQARRLPCASRCRCC